MPPGHVLPVGGGVIISSLLPVSCDLPLGPRSRGREGISGDVSRETYSAGGSRPAAVDNARGGIEVAGSSPSTEGGSKPNLLERCAETGVPRFTTLGKGGRATRQGADFAQGARSEAVHRVTVSMRQDQVPASTSPPQSPLHGVSTVGALGRRARLGDPSRSVVSRETTWRRAHAGAPFHVERAQPDRQPPSRGRNVPRCEGPPTRSSSGHHPGVHERAPARGPRSAQGRAPTHGRRFGPYSPRVTPGAQGHACVKATDTPGHSALIRVRTSTRDRTRARTDACARACVWARAGVCDRGGV